MVHCAVQCTKIIFIAFGSSTWVVKNAKWPPSPFLFGEKVEDSCCEWQQGLYFVTATVSSYKIIFGQDTNLSLRLHDIITCVEQAYIYIS